MNVPIGKVCARAFTIPTDKPEADGTIAWRSTTLVVVEINGGDKVGLGYTYSGASIVQLIESKLADSIAGLDALNPEAAWQAMQRTVRNLGREGLAATAISAVDIALHDLKARILDLPLATLLGRYRDAIPIYGSGGFTTYTDDELQNQLGGWVERDGCVFVKMKVGTNPKTIHGACRSRRKRSEMRRFLWTRTAPTRSSRPWQLAACFADQDVGWFEEPVSSDDLRGLRAIRERAPAVMDIAAGEYAYTTSVCAHDARSGCRRRPASRRDPLWRRHRLPADCRIVRGLSDRSVRPLRAGVPSACRLRGSAVAPSRMVS